MHTSFLVSRHYYYYEKYNIISEPNAFFDAQYTAPPGLTANVWKSTGLLKKDSRVDFPLKEEGGKGKAFSFLFTIP